MKSYLEYTICAGLCESGDGSNFSSEIQKSRHTTRISDAQRIQPGIDAV